MLLLYQHNIMPLISQHIVDYIHCIITKTACWKYISHDDLYIILLCRLISAATQCIESWKILDSHFYFLSKFTWHLDGLAQIWQYLWLPSTTFFIFLFVAKLLYTSSNAFGLLMLLLIPQQNNNKNLKRITKHNVIRIKKY